MADETKTYYLDLAGLQQYDQLIKQYIADKDLVITGTLVEGDYTTIKALSDALKELNLGDTNVIESISVNGYDAEIKDKKATVTIPEATTTASGVMSAADKIKLDGIETGAQVNVQADWNETDTTSDAFIKNKPTDLVKTSRTIAGINLEDDITKAELLTALNAEDGAQANYIKSVGDNLNVDEAGKLTVTIPAASVTGVKEGDSVLSLDGTSLTSTISLSYDSGKKEIYLKGKGEEVISTVSAADFIKDGMIDNVAWSAETGKETTLVITFNTDAGKEAVEVDFQKLVDTYTAGNGIDVNGQVVSVKIATPAADAKDVVTLSATADGLSATLTGWDTLKAKVDDLDKDYAPLTHTHSIADITDFAPIDNATIAGLFSE